jgi:hypothetical protein
MMAKKVFTRLRMSRAKIDEDYSQVHALDFPRCPYCLEQTLDIEDTGADVFPENENGLFIEITCPDCQRDFYAQCAVFTTWTSFFKKNVNWRKS